MTTSHYSSQTDVWYERYFGADYLAIDVQPHTDREVAFLSEVLGLSSETRLLDAPCGYGRHLLQLVQAGIPVTGFDLSPEMLAEARRRLDEAGCDAPLVRGDLREMPFEDVFDCACCMFNSFGYFADERDNFMVLKAYRRALVPGGLFVLDLVNRDFVIRAVTPKDWFYHKGTVILEKKWIDPLLNRSEIDVSVVDKRGKRDYHHSIRLYTVTEITMLLEAAGFVVRDVFGGFQGEPFDSGRDRMIIIAEALPAEDI